MKKSPIFFCKQDEQSDTDVGSKQQKRPHHYRDDRHSDKYERSSKRKRSHHKSDRHRDRERSNSSDKRAQARAELRKIEREIDQLRQKTTPLETHSNSPVSEAPSDHMSISDEQMNIHSLLESRLQDSLENSNELPPKSDESSGSSSSSNDDSDDSSDESSDSSSDSSEENEVNEEETENHKPNSDKDTEMIDSPESAPGDLENLLPIYIPALQGCRSVDDFKHLNRIEEGTYGVVYRAQDLRTDQIVALKRLKMEKEKEGFPITSLREINTLLKSQHPNIVPLREIVVGSNMDKIYMVMDYLEHDLKSLMEVMKNPFLIGEVKTIMMQLLKGVDHLHDNWILHRDLKTSNLLFSHSGELKIGDFGLAREYGSPLKQYTPIVVTLWYRAPELLLGTKLYSCPIDMWSVGCIFAELLTQKALFPAKSEIEQLNLIFKELGTPNEKIWPGYNELPMVKKVRFTDHPYNCLRKRFGATLSDLGFELLNRFLTYDPKKRITASAALKHGFFVESPHPTPKHQFPTWPAKSEGSIKRSASPKAPLGGLAFSKSKDDDINVADAPGFQLTHAKHGLAKRGPGFSLKF